MPCCNMSIYKPRFVEPKCDDGCFCILTNGNNCICLFIDEDKKIKRCNDCKCEKSNCNCICAENPCASNKKCSCFLTKGKTCVCVNVDKKGNIKVCDDCQCTNTNENTEIPSKCIKTNVSQEELIPCSNCQCRNIDCKDCQCISGRNIKCCGNTSEIKVKQSKDHQRKKNDTETDSGNYCNDCKCANKNKRCVCLATEGQPCVCISINKNGKIIFCKDCQCVSRKGLKCTSGCGDSTQKTIKSCNNIANLRNDVPDLKINKMCIDCACSSQDKECVCLATPNGACVCVNIDQNGFVQICEDCQCSSRKFVKGNNNCHVKQYTKVTNRAVNMYCAKCVCTDDVKKCVCLATADKECVCVYIDKIDNIKLCEDCECVSEKCTQYAGEPCVSKQSNIKSKVQFGEDCQCVREKDVKEGRKDNNDYGTKQCYNRRLINSRRGCSVRHNTNCKYTCEINSNLCNSCCSISATSSKIGKSTACDSCTCIDQEKHYVGRIDPNQKLDNVQFCEDCQCVSKRNLKDNTHNSNKCENSYCNPLRTTTNMICESCTCNNEKKKCICLVVAGKTCVCVYTDERGKIQLCKDCKCTIGSCVIKSNSFDKKHCQSSCCSNICCKHSNRAFNRFCDSCACKDPNKNCVCFVTEDKTCFCVYTDKRGNIQPCEDCQCTSDQRKKRNSSCCINQFKSCSSNTYCNRFFRAENKLCDSCACRNQNKNCVCFATANKTCVCMYTDKCGNIQHCGDCQCVTKNKLKDSDFKTKQCDNNCCQFSR